MHIVVRIVPGYFCIKKEKLMMTREEEELGIPFWNFYKAKQASRLNLQRIKAIATVRFPKKWRRRQEESYKMHFFGCFQYVLA